MTFRGVILGAILLLGAGCGLPDSVPVPGAEAELVLRDMLAGDGASDLKRLTGSPTRVDVRYTARGRTYDGHVYLPAGPVGAGMVMVPGASPYGREDPRLVAFARTLARARFAVLVPELPGLKELKVKASDARDLADAFSYLISRPDLTPGGRAGLGATSYAVGPAVMAALDPDVSDRMRFLLAIGGYYDLERVVTFFTTGHYKDDSKGPASWIRMDPGEYGKWVFLASYSDRLTDPADRIALKTMADRKLADAAASIDDLRTALGAEGRSVDALMTNADPDKVTSLIASLPEAARADIAALNLRGRDLGAMRARPILVHGYDDTIVPYTESVALAHALRERSPRLYLANGLSHVDFKQPGFMDVWNLYAAVNALLAERGPLFPAIRVW
ncbi:MAG: alpha/beta hydrolase [Candidatus Sericytochromatia bacterium]|nr:alpha/beta hydrolase [Candidatus Tanganyikabacteria bacterium]